MILTQLTVSQLRTGMMDYWPKFCDGDDITTKEIRHNVDGREREKILYKYLGNFINIKWFNRTSQNRQIIIQSDTTRVCQWRKFLEKFAIIRKIESSRVSQFSGEISSFKWKLSCFQKKYRSGDYLVEDHQQKNVFERHNDYTSSTVLHSCHMLIVEIDGTSRKLCKTSEFYLLLQILQMSDE